MIKKTEEDMNRPRIPWITMLIIGLVVVMISNQVTADNPAMPRTLNYQGRLTDDQGQPITNTFSMTFTIYDAETDGESKWSETHPSVSVINGLFSVTLGEGTPAMPVHDTVFSNPDRWLEIVVAGETITPRTKLTSSAYALQAGWTMIDDVLYTAGNWGIARNGSVLLGDYWDYRYDVNLGDKCTTGAVGSGSTGKWNTVSGGRDNVARSHEDNNEGGVTVSGGVHNRALAEFSTIGGGIYNTVLTSEDWPGKATIGGGAYNVAVGEYSTIGGGSRDSATGWCSTIPGGRNNTAGGRYSFASGRNAKARHDGSWVWADTTDADFESTADNQFLIRADGGVGININTPLSPMYVGSEGNWAPDVGHGWGDFSVGDTTYGLSVGVATGGGGAGNVRIWTNGGQGDLKFGNATYGDWVTMDTTGNVGFGTSEPAGNIHVLDDAPTVIIDADEEEDAKILFRDADDPTLQTFEIAFNAADQDLHIKSDDNSGADIITVTHGGLIGIKETNPSVSLHVNGSICYTGSIGACSDGRYKKDVMPITGAIDKLDRLHGVSFNWRKDKYPKKEFDDKSQLGLIAQEVKEVFPELVMQDNDGYYSVDYAKLTPVLIEAIKEQQKQIETLSKRIDELEEAKLSNR